MAVFYVTVASRSLWDIAYFNDTISTLGFAGIIFLKDDIWIPKFKDFFLKKEKIYCEVFFKYSVVQKYLYNKSLFVEFNDIQDLHLFGQKNFSIIRNLD